MPEVIIKTKVRKIFAGRQVTNNALERLDIILYNKLKEINESDLDLLEGRITEDVMIKLLEKWLD